MPRTAVALLGAALTLAAPAAVHADKLVVFHNGRTLRVQEFRTEGDWGYLVLGKRSEIGVPGKLIAQVLDVTSAQPATVPNVQAAAGGGGGGVDPSGGRPAPTRIVGQADPAMEQPIPLTLEGQGGIDPDAAAAAARARSDALARAAARSGRLRGTGGQEGAEGDPEAPPGLELGGGSGLGPGNWPSMLDRGRPRGRDAAADPAGGSGEDDADPER